MAWLLALRSQRNVLVVDCRQGIPSLALALKFTPTHAYCYRADRRRR